MATKTVRRVWNEYLELLRSDKDCSVLDLSLPEKTNRGTASITYQYDHSVLKREMILHLHSVILENLAINKLTPYTELALELHRAFNVKVNPSTIRRALVRDFNYIVDQIPTEQFMEKLLMQSRQFLYLYSGINHNKL